MTVRDEGIFELDMPEGEINAELDCVDELALFDVIPAMDWRPWLRNVQSPYMANWILKKGSYCWSIV